MISGVSAPDIWFYSVLYGTAAPFKGVTMVCLVFITINDAPGDLIGATHLPLIGLGFPTCWVKGIDFQLDNC